MNYTRIVCSTRLLCLLAAIVLFPVATPAQDKTAEDTKPESESSGTKIGDINVIADNYEFQPGTSWATAKGNVRISYRGIILEADEIRVNARTKEVEANGNVYFYTLESIESPVLKKRFFWNGDKLTGNFDEPHFESGGHQILAGVWYETGNKAVYQSDGRLIFHNVSISTCEHIHTGHEHYSLSARKVIYTPEGKIKAYHSWYKVGDVPIFYWPFVVWNTEEDGGNVHWRAGYDGDWGGYILTSRSWKINEQLDTKLQLDWRSKRGFAVGNRTRRQTENSESELMFYVLHDEDPPETTDDYNRRFDIEDDRYRLRLKHLQNFGENLTLRLNLDAMSDIDYLEEWFEDDYDQYRQVQSYIDLRYDHERFSASLNARPRLNDFYSVVERLPEIRIDFPRQTVPWIPGLLYEGETSLADLEMDWREFDKPRAAGLRYPADYDSLRFDTLHMFYYPMLLAGDLLKLVPRAGVRWTYYENTSETNITSGDLVNMYAVDDPDRSSSSTMIKNYDDDGGSAVRFTGELGVELSSKFYRVWNDADSDFWNVDGLRHVIQPFVNYTYIPEPTEDRENLYFFDLVDRITEQNFVRVGVDQRLQTRHPSRDEIYTLARLNTYADFHFETAYDRDHLGDFAVQLEIKPRPSISARATVITDMHDGNLNRAEIGLGFGTPDTLRIDIAYLYRDDYDTHFLRAMGSTLTDYTGENIAALRFGKNHYAALTAQFPIGSKTDGYVRYEFDLDQSELARQVYQITHDLHCWMGGLRFEEEDGESQVQLVLYLKAFPSIGTGAGTHQTGL